MAPVEKRDKPRDERGRFAPVIHVTVNINVQHQPVEDDVEADVADEDLTGRTPMGFHVPEQIDEDGATDEDEEE